MEEIRQQARQPSLMYEFMKVEMARADNEILAAYPVMRQLRPHLSERSFLEAIRRMEKESFH